MLGCCTFQQVLTFEFKVLNSSSKPQMVPDRGYLLTFVMKGSVDVTDTKIKFIG